MRSAEVEELLGLASDPLQGPSNSTSMLTNADFKFKPVKDSNGKVLDLAQGTIGSLLHNPERKVRRAAYENYMDKYHRTQEYTRQQFGSLDQGQCVLYARPQT